MGDTRINTKKVSGLPESTTIADSDILLKENSVETNKFKVSTLINYIKNHTAISSFFMHQSSRNEANGVAPLDANKKLPSANITFGKTSGTVYEGNNGSALESSLDTEKTRAQNAESTISSNLTSEITRSKNAENKLTTDLSSEVSRAKSSENTLTTNLNAEITRATNAESVLRTDLNTINSKISNVNNTSDANKPVSTAQQQAIDLAYANANAYTDSVKAEIMGGMPAETLDTITEIANAITENESILDTLNGAVGTKASQAELDTHTGNNTIHITATEHTNFNDANSKKHTHNNKTVLDGITSALITAWNSAVTHVSDTVKHITASERTAWNAAKTHADSSHAPSNSERNIIVGVQKNGTDVAVNSTTRKVNITVPTKMSELENDAGFSGGTAITVDSALSSTSTNPVQNKVVNSALAGKAASSHTHSYLPLAGGTMTGDLKMKSGDYTATPIKLYSGDVNGAALVSQAGGLYIAGSGESAQNLYSALGIFAGTERTFITSDQDISFVTNCQTIENKKTVLIDSDGKITAPGGFSGNSSSATKLATARTINGTPYNGTANITTSSWGTARNITIGNKTNTVNGSANVSYSLNDIGAMSKTHEVTSATEPTNQAVGDYWCREYT